MPQVVGLDIGASAVRAAELDVGSGTPVLKTFGQVGLPPGAIVDGEVQDASAVADAISRLWKNGRFNSRSVIVGIAGLRAITREIDLPFVPDDEIDSAVRFQSEEVIPFPPDKTILSAQVLADYQSPDGATMRRVLVAAAHRDLVDGVVEAVEKAGLQVEGVDLVSSALVRALADPTQSDQPEAIVSVGAGLTVVVVHQQGRPQFVRTIGTGGNAATAAISSALDLPLADSEAVKRRLGEPVPQVQAAERAVQPSIAELVGEIRNSIQYFASLPGRAPIARVLVTGGASRLRGFIEQLQAQVRIPVQATSPLARLDLSQLELRPDQAASIDPVLSAPIGLALPEPNSSVKKFNLVPPEVLQRALQKKVTLYTSVVFGALILVMLLWGGVKYLQVQSDQTAVDNATVQIQTLKNEIPQFDPIVAAANVLATTKAQVSGITTAYPDWYANILQLAADDPCLPAPYNGCLVIATFSGTGGGSSAAAGSIGMMSLAISGSFAQNPDVLPLSVWLDNIGKAGPNYPSNFPAPAVTSITTSSGPNGTTTAQFSSTVTILPQGSLAKNTSF